jgi:hypothetical protein
MKVDMRGKGLYSCTFLLLMHVSYKIFNGLKSQFLSDTSLLFDNLLDTRKIKFSGSTDNLIGCGMFYAYFH